MSKHTPEPWVSSVALSGSENDRGFDIHADGKHIARVSPMIKNLRGDASTEAIANKDRILACVNACAGVNPEAVPDAVAALRDMLDGYERLLEQSVLDVNPGANRYSIAARAALAKLEDVG